MNRKLTAKQAEALALIEDNPGRVEAITRVLKGMLRFNGNTELALMRAGMIEKVGPAWKLSDTGRDALRAHTLAHLGK